MLKNFQMRYVYKLLEMLAEWRRLEKDDFYNLPFAMKMDMEKEDILRLHRTVTGVISCLATETQLSSRCLAETKLSSRCYKLFSNRNSVV